VQRRSSDWLTRCDECVHRVLCTSYYESRGPSVVIDDSTLDVILYVATPRGGYATESTDGVYKIITSSDATNAINSRVESSRVETSVE